MTHFHKFDRLHEICFMFLYSNVYTVVRDNKYMQPRGTHVHCDYLSFTIILKKKRFPRCYTRKESLNTVY